MTKPMERRITSYTLEVVAPGDTYFGEDPICPTLIVTWESYLYGEGGRSKVVSSWWAKPYRDWIITRCGRIGKEILVADRRKWTSWVGKEYDLDLYSRTRDCLYMVMP